MTLDYTPVDRPNHAGSPASKGRVPWGIRTGRPRPGPDGTPGVAAERNRPRSVATGLPAHRIQEARDIAAVSGWYDHCADPRCRDRQDCVGKLRRIGDSTRTYPGCLAFALGTFIDPHATAATTAKAMRMFPDESSFGPDDHDVVPLSMGLLAILMSRAAAEGRRRSLRNGKPA